MKLPFEISLKPDAKNIFIDIQDKRFVVIVAGRRYGKSFLIAYDLIWNAYKSKVDICYVAPTLKQARKIMWFMLLDLIDRKMIADTNKTDMVIRLVNGSTISIYGGTAYDSIRGGGFNYVYLDEAAYIPEEAWTEVLRQTLATTQGRARFISTPNGKSNWFYDLTLSSDYTIYHRQSVDGGWIPEEEIESARSQLDEKTFNEEYLATFETSGSTVYYSYSEKNYCDYVYNPSRKTILAFDFNVNPLCTIVLQEIEVNKWAAVKEFVIPNQNTEGQCQVIDNWFKKVGMPSHLEITGDHTGHSYGTKAAVTDYNIIEKYFKNYSGYLKKTRQTKRQKNRVAATNGMFRAADGTIKLYVNIVECPKLDKDLKVVEWKENGVEINKGLGISDPSDALSYFPYNYFPIKNEIESILI